MTDESTGNSPSPAATGTASASTGSPEGVTSATESSAASTTSTESVAGPQGKQDGEAAASSTAEKPDAKKEAPKKLLDVVKNAVKAAPAKEASSDSGSKKGKEEPGTDPKGKVDGEELPPFHKHPRWQEMQTKYSALETKAAVLQKDADQFKVVDTFMKENKLNPSQVADGFKVMALIVNHPEQALVELQKYKDAIELQLGKKLPADLQEQVDNGYVSEPVARELSLRRQSETSLKGERDTERQGREADQLNTLKRDIAGTITAWEASQAKTDPDYSKVKQPLVLDRVHAIIHERGKLLSSPEDARIVAEQALKDVNERLKSVLPPRTELRNIPPAGNRPVSAGKPKNLKEAISGAYYGTT